MTCLPRGTADPGCVGAPWSRDTWSPSWIGRHTQVHKQGSREPWRGLAGETRPQSEDHLPGLSPKAGYHPGAQSGCLSCIWIYGLGRDRVIKLLLPTVSREIVTSYYSFDICFGFNLTANKICFSRQLVLIKILTQKVIVMLLLLLPGFCGIHIGAFSTGKLLGSIKLLT